MEQTSSSILQVSHVSKQVKSGDNQLTILRDVNLTLKQGESVAILGASGSGKTTLLTIIAGLELPTNGKIIYRNASFTDMTDEERTSIRGKEMGFIFQNFQLLPTLTALENVMLPLELQYVSSKEARKEALFWLSRVGLSARLHHYPNQLSGGEEQRVAIARAFVTHPRLLLADEMTGNLDIETGKYIAEILFSLNREEHTTLVLVTHEETLAANCERRLLLKEGKLHLC